MHRRQSEAGGEGGLTSPFRIEALLPAGFRGRVVEGSDAAARASLVSGPFRASPLACISPHDLDELTHILRRAFESGTPIVPRGGGTGMPGGNLGSGVILETGEAFAEIRWLDREAGRIRTGVGASAGDLARIAGEAGFLLPFLPSSSPWCRVGGIVANNAAGARTFRYGSAATFVEAIEGLYAWGEPFRVERGLPAPEPFARAGEGAIAAGADDPALWPAVAKNSSGYALDRYLRSGDAAQLLVGSEGTLAFLTAVEWRLPPSPKHRGLVLLPAASAREVQELALGAAALGTETCEFLGRRFVDIARLEEDPETGPLLLGRQGLLLEVAGDSQAEVAAASARVQEMGTAVSGRGIAALQPETVERLWRLRRAASPMIAREAGGGRISTQFIEDSVVPPGCVAEYLEGIDRILADGGFDGVVFGHAGDGNIHVNPLLDVHASDWMARVRRVMEETVELVASLGGTLTGEHGDGRVRAPYLERIWPAPVVAGFRAVKDALDPQGILNPGVILPLPGQDPFEGFQPRPRVYPPGGSE